MSTQENKITIILIAVVVLFILCQTPNAVYLFYVSWFEQPQGAEAKNVKLGKISRLIIFIFTHFVFVILNK